MTALIDPDVQLFLRAWFDGLVPPDELSVTEWAEKYRELSGEACIFPGPYRSERTPYVREILDALHPNSGVKSVTWMKASQVAGSETGNNWIGYLIDQAPCAMMIVQPTLDLAKRYSRTRISPMLRDSKRLAEIVPPGRSRDSENLILEKKFRGGVLLLAGANSAASLRSQPLKCLMLDEIDNWPLDVDGEGDPCGLAERRLSWSGDSAKIFRLSSPKLKGSSRIEQYFIEGDQRYFFVPCPHCDEMQKLVFANLIWEKGKPESALYRCDACASLIEEVYKADMLEGGEWRATAIAKDPRDRSYHLNSLYSPPGSLSWSDMARDFEKAHASGSPLILQVFVNTELGESWAGTGEAPDAEQLFERTRFSKYSAGFVPRGALVLTAGVDVQKDRLEVEVVGWGRNGESWSIEYFILTGDHVLPAVWEELDKILGRSWVHEGGCDIQIARLAVDAAFDQTAVAKWVRRQSGGRVMAIHGSDHLPMILGQVRRADVRRDGKTVQRGGFVLWPVGSSIAKTELYGRLRIKPPVGDEPYPPGFCHFPRDYGLSYFQQLTAEQLIFVHTRTGASKPTWVKKGRNEALDCRTYARAAAAAYGIDRFRDANWDEHAEALGVADEAFLLQPPSEPRTAATSPPAPPPRAPKPPAREKKRPERGGGFKARRGEWMKRWRD